MTDDSSALMYNLRALKGRDKVEVPLRVMGTNLVFISVENKPKMKRIFTIKSPYYRGKNSNEQNGYGLGLYLVKCYMDRMGGGMEYYNDNGFTVELLLKKVQADNVKSDIL